MSVHSLALTDGLLERWWWRREEGAFLTLICCREVERKGRVCQRCEGLAEAGWFRSIHRTAIISFGFGYHVTVTGAGLSIPLNVCVCSDMCVSVFLCLFHPPYCVFSYDYSLRWLGSTVNGIGESIWSFVNRKWMLDRTNCCLLCGSIGSFSFSLCCSYFKCTEYISNAHPHIYTLYISYIHTYSMCICTQTLTQC